MLSPAVRVASSRSVAPGVPTKPPDAPEIREARAFSETEGFRWMRRAVAIAVPVLGVVTISTAYADTMPIFHHTAAWIAVAVMTAAWVVELAGVPWPRIALVAAIVLPNAWLTVIGHDALNYFYLWLLVTWVAFAGTRHESILALSLAMATITFDWVFVAINGGPFNWGLLAWLLLSLCLVWFMGLSLRREHQRSQELATLLTVSRSVASPLEMHALLDTIFDALGTVLDYSAIAVLTLNEQHDTLTFAHMRAPRSHRVLELQRMRYSVTDLGTAWDRLCKDEPVVIPDVNKTAAEVRLARRMAADGDADSNRGIVRSLMWIPLVVHDQIVGILSISGATPHAFGVRDATLALGIARQAALAIDNARLHEGAREAAVLEERQRLSRELHDSVTQALYGISLYAEAAGRALTGGTTEPAVTELGMSGIVDPLEGSLAARTLFVAPERKVIRSANGFLFVPRFGFDTLPPVDRVVVAPGEEPFAKQQVIAAWSTHRPQLPAEDIYGNVGSGETAYDASFVDITRTRNGSLARATATMLLYAGASQVDDTTRPIREMLTALTLSAMGAAFVYAPSHRSTPRRVRVRRVPQPA